MTLPVLGQELGGGDEHWTGQACVRCSLLRPDPSQRARLEEIRDSLLARITEARREGWLGEVEGLQVSLAGANDKLDQLDQRTHRHSSTHLGMPGFLDIASHAVTTSKGPA